jgi:hypothetical protein
MIARRIEFLAAVGLLVLATGPSAIAAPAEEKDDDFSELNKDFDKAPPPPQATPKMVENPGSRYQPSDKKKPPPEGRFSKPKGESSPSADKSSRSAAADAKREKLAKMIAARLDKLPPLGKAKKAADDYFLVGTSEVRLAERHADVRFESVQGQKEVAAHLAEYVVSAPEQTLRQWHVFTRVKSSEEAESFLTDLRAQWDSLEKMQADQAKLARNMSQAYRSASDLRGRMGGYARTMCRT